MEHSSMLRRYGAAYIALFGADAFAERLMFDGKPTLAREQGLVCCSLCDDAGATPPWRDYLDRDAENDDRRENDDTASESAFHGYLRVNPEGALEALIAWLHHVTQPGRIPHALALIARAVRITDSSTVFAAGVELTGTPRALLALGIADAIVSVDTSRAAEIL